MCYRQCPNIHFSESGEEARNDMECFCDRCVDDTNGMVVKPGDIVTIDLTMTPENGFVPEPLFDTTGRISFVVGWGNYLPALHTLVQGNRIGEGVKNLSVDAGWGDRDPNLVMTLPKSKLQRFLNQDGSMPPTGHVIHLHGGLQLTVVEVDEEKEKIVVDANPPLAGASYDCSFKILDIEPLPLEAMQHTTRTAAQAPRQSSSRYQVSTWALGCFWGGELAFMRVPGVVGTRVGYTQGITSNPKYEDVCTGKTKHREAIMVVYDPTIVSYKELFHVATKRLADTKTMPNNSPPGMFLDMFAEEDDERYNEQYRHGIYYHTQEQFAIANSELITKNPYSIEMKKAAVFYDAEEDHQQYLLKGGQSARKGAKETIRCYG